MVNFVPTVRVCSTMGADLGRRNLDTILSLALRAAYFPACPTEHAWEAIVRQT